MANQVLVQLLRKNAYDYTCIHQESINCEAAVSEGVYWRIPTVSKGVHTGFTMRKSATKPTPDSMKTIKVRDRVNGQTYYVAIADDANDQLFNEQCNACCDDVDALPTVAFPDIIIEEQGCADAEGDYNYFATVSVSPPPAGSVYKLSGSVNGVALPAAPAEGFATLGALETWADANWSTGDLDGVTIDGNKVTLHAGPSGVTGGIQITIEQYFESNTPGALAGGQNYRLAATINGTVLPVLNAAADAALSTLATLANNTASHAQYGTWSEVAGKIRLVSTNTTISAATLTVTKVP